MPAHLFFLLGFLLIPPWPPSSAESPSCITVYREGGAAAVFRSPSCPRWTLLPTRPPANCQLATHQGRRRSQEDRAVCAIGIRIPFLRTTGVREVSVSILAVFDGHNGAEASDMASRLLLEYFLLHVYFLLDGIYSLEARRYGGALSYDGEGSAVSRGVDLDERRRWRDLDKERFKWTLPSSSDDTLHMEILQESLLRTIHDIDETFSKESTEASRRNLESGSTATIVLIADGQFVAANVGDSKALLCSQDFHSIHVQKGNRSRLNRRRRQRTAVSTINEINNFKLGKADGKAYYVKELTKDHHPDRDDERSRIEASGGYIVEWAGVLRVNGELAVSRAIGDIPFKNYGVISTPEVTDWQSLSSNDSFLIASSDGIFEKMTTQEVCDVLWDENSRSNVQSKVIPTITRSFVDAIVQNAYERGTVDNMAVVLLPLGPSISGESVDPGCDLEGIPVPSAFQQQQVMGNKLGDGDVPTSLIPMEYFNQVTLKFNRLLVEAQYKGLGCFYLSENLSDNTDYIFRAPEHYYKDDVHGLYHALPDPLGSYHDGDLLNIYNEQNTCWHFGIHDGDKGCCTSPEAFVNFLGLLDSIPYIDMGSNSSESAGHKFPDFRYTLKKRFDRGSYGEVWLAFHWNCSEENDVLSKMGKNLPSSIWRPHFNPLTHNSSMHTESFNGQCSDNSSYDNMFILKRIMVERGITAYFSGLREKYFGEIFLNASMSTGGLRGTGVSTDCSIEELDRSVVLQNMSDPDEMEYNFNSRDSSCKESWSRNITDEEGLKHIARFVESFESGSKEIWLVFRNEGLSLSKLIYKAEETIFLSDNETEEPARNVLVLHPSSWWYWLRTTEAGRKEMQNLIQQLLLAIKSCHDRNITHRDIKPENMIICFEDEDTGRCLMEPAIVGKQYHLKMRIIDFGSAIDEFTLKHLYGSGPTRSEQTYEYTPPEALLNASWFQGPTFLTLKYDMWSVGVVMLELIFASPHVFQISDRNRALLDRHLEGWSDQIKELAYKLRSYMEMCILIPGLSSQHHQHGGTTDHGRVWPASWKCSEDSFLQQVKSRDPLKMGFPNIWALRLVRQLLVWHPEDRISVDEALSHPYFRQQ